MIFLTICKKKDNHTVASNLNLHSRIHKQTLISAILSIYFGVLLANHLLYCLFTYSSIIKETAFPPVKTQFKYKF